MGASYDVAIAGAGIVGAACAMECAAAGLNVVVVEPGPIGGGATAAGMGHVVVMDDSPAQIALTLYSRTLWIEMIPELPGDCEYLPCGTFWVAADDEEMDEVRRKHQVAESGGTPYRTEVLDGRADGGGRTAPARGLAGALYVPEDSTVYPPCAARYFLEKSRATVVAAAGCGHYGAGNHARATAPCSPPESRLTRPGAWAPELTPGIAGPQAQRPPRDHRPLSRLRAARSGGTRAT